jgi:hypothetical protein
VRPKVVVAAAPYNQLATGFGRAVEQLLIEEFVAQGSVEQASSSIARVRRLREAPKVLATQTIDQLPIGRSRTGRRAAATRLPVARVHDLVHYRRFLARLTRLDGIAHIKASLYHEHIYGTLSRRFALKSIVSS